MKRRSFLRVATTAGAAFVTAPFVTGCSDHDGIAYAAWQGPSEDLSAEDVRLRIVAFGLLAPSNFNLQPWWVSIKQPGITIAIEPPRLLPYSDPDHRETFISHGCFLEAMRLAAGHYGLTATATLFPDGIPDPSGEFAAPVARVDVREGGAEDPLFRFLQDRRTVRIPFSSTSVAPDELTALEASAGPDAQIVWFTSPEDRQRIARTIEEKAAALLHDAKAFQERMDMIRWTSSGIESTRDGSSLENLGLTGTSLLTTRLFGPRGSGFADHLLDLTRTQARTAAAFGILVTHGSGRSEELAAGAAFLRVHLSATARGIALQPMNDPIQGPADTLPDGLIPEGSTPQMVFRIGYADSVTPSPRRTLFEIVRI